MKICFHTIFVLFLASGVLSGIAAAQGTDQNEKSRTAPVNRDAQDGRQEGKSDAVDQEKKAAEKDTVERDAAERDRADKERLEKAGIEKEKAEREKQEREARERAEREKLERERLEKEKSKKSRLSVVDLSTREYLALFVGYGGFFPVADYGSQYKPAHLVTGTIGIYVLNFVGLSPELHARYTPMDSKEDPLMYSSKMSLVQFYPAIVYRHHFRLPRNTLTVYGRIWDGLSRVSYTSRNPYFPYIKENIVENINTFGLSAGCYYDVWKGILVGVDFGYSIVFTAGKPLQSMTLTLNAGYRIL